MKFKGTYSQGVEFTMTAKELWQARFALRGLWRLAQWLPLSKKRGTATFDEYFSAPLLEALGESRGAVEAVLRTYCSDYLSAAQPAVGGPAVETEPDILKALPEAVENEKNLGSIFKGFEAVFIERLSRFPNGREKAIAFLQATLGLEFGVDAEDYEAAIWLAEQGYDLRTWVAQERNEWLEAVKRRQERLSPWKAFWAAPRRGELSWPFFFLHFGTYFGIPGFDDVWDEVRQDLKQVLASDPAENPHFLLLLALAPEVGRLLWPETLVACERLLREQIDQTHWQNPHHSFVRNSQGELVRPPDPWLSTLYATFLERYGLENHREAARRTAQWLLQQQGASGAWYREFRPGEVHDEIITTLAAVHLIRRTGVDPNNYAVTPAVDWIWKQQEPDGTFRTVLTDIVPTEIIVLVLRMADLPPHSVGIPETPNAVPVKPDVPQLPRAVILTALPVEYATVREHLVDLAEETRDGTVYERGQFLSGRLCWEIWLAEIGSGNGTSALEAQRAIAQVKPSVLMFVGVAGGIKDVNIGDVVAGTKLYNYESGKVESVFHTRPEVGEPSYRLIQRARAEAKKQDWLARIKPKVEGRPQVLMGAMASGEKVLASTTAEQVELIRTSYNDALAVEMEGYGVLMAAQVNGVHALVVRGISDRLDGKAEADAAGSQEIASRNAGAFAFEVLSKLDIYA